MMRRAFSLVAAVSLAMTGTMIVPGAAAFDPTDPADALGDTDGDGWSNREEYARGTDPLDPDTDGDGVVDSVDPHPLFPDCDWSATTSCSNELGHLYDESPVRHEGGPVIPDGSATPGQGNRWRPVALEPLDSDGDGIEE